MLAETPCSPCYSEVSASLENTLPDCSNYHHFTTLCKINVSMYIPKQGDISSPYVTVLDFRVMDLSLSLLSLSFLSSLSYRSLTLSLSLSLSLSLFLSLMSKLLYVIAGSDPRGGVVELWTASHSSFVFLVCTSLSSELAPQLV